MEPNNKKPETAEERELTEEEKIAKAKKEAELAKAKEEGEKKKRPFYKRPLVIIPVGLIMLCCLSVMAMGVYLELTPSGQATQVAMEAADATEDAEKESAKATEDAQPTETPEPTGTSGPTDTPEPTDPPPPTNTPEPSPTPEPKDALLGELTENGFYSLVALQVEDPAPGGVLFTPVEGKKLVGVEVIIANVADDPITINALDSTLIDTEGFAYEAEIFGRDDMVELVELNAGERVRGWLSFVIPEEATPDRVRYDFGTFTQLILETQLMTADGESIASDDVPLTMGEPVDRELTGKLGELVEKEGYSLEAQAIEDPSSGGALFTPVAGFRLVAVEIVVGNVSGDLITTNPLNATLVDTDRFVYTAEVFGRDDAMDLTDLEAGLKTKGWVSFLIPENAEIESLKYQISGFPNIVIETGLGE